MIKILTVTITTIMILSLLIVSCAPPTLTPVTTPEPKIPSHFTTYTSEGLFNISYPPDWMLATSIMEEIMEEVKEDITSTDPTIDWEGTKVVFFAGLLGEVGYYPMVNILVTPCSTGFSTLDEIDESESLWAKEYTEGYREITYTRTIVDGREASILDSEDNEPGYGRWRYLQLTTIKDSFVWVVSCGSEYKDFQDWEGSFNSIIRSIRILD